jgi:hypothetical protein
VWIYTNDFFTDVADLSSEDKSFTLFLADNMLLDTTDDGAFKEGYISNLFRFVVPGLVLPEQLPAPLVSVAGTELDLPGDKFGFLGKASNGMVYKLKSLEDLHIPVNVIWEFTDIPGFDSIRGISTTDYLPYYDSLHEMRVIDLQGGFTEFMYTLGGGPLHGDYLKISTVGGTFVTLEWDVPALLPGKYRVSINALIRASDGITYDAYFNDRLISEGNDFNNGLYEFKRVEIGFIEISEESPNVFSMEVDGTESSHIRCFIDYLIFEPYR